MKRGFTLLIAILVSAVLLSVALAIFDLTTRQLELSTTAQNSQMALFAADSGIECANYWDLHPADGISEFPFASTNAGPTFPYNTIYCGVSSISMPGSGNFYSFEQDDGANPTIATTTFSFSMNNGTYVEVSVTKYCYSGSNDGTCQNSSGTGVVVNSYGYNSGPNLADPSRIERALRETYGYSPSQN
jgi:hypothetical protein